MRTAFRVYNQNTEPTSSDLVQSIVACEAEELVQRERVTIDLTVPGRRTTHIEDLAPIWIETGPIVPPRRNPWRATRGNRVSRVLSRDTRDFQCHFLCSNNVPTEEIPESEQVPHHLAFAIPTPSTDPTEESERLHSFTQIGNHHFVSIDTTHLAEEAWHIT